VQDAVPCLAGDAGCRSRVVGRESGLPTPRRHMSRASPIGGSPSVRPAARRAGLSRMPWRRASRPPPPASPGPNPWSRPARRLPSREPAVTRSSPSVLAHHHTSRPTAAADGGEPLAGDSFPRRGHRELPCEWHPSSRRRRPAPFRGGIFVCAGVCAVDLLHAGVKPSAAGGMNGIPGKALWATTTGPASSRLAGRRGHVERRCLVSEVTRVSGRTGSSNLAA